MTHKFFECPHPQCNGQLRIKSDAPNGVYLCICKAINVLIKDGSCTIAPRYCCDRTPHKHGKDRQGYQRYKCPICNRTFSDNPEPKKAGRKPIGDRPMTNAERKRRQRNKNK